MRSGLNMRICRTLLALAMGGSMLQISSCSPSVRDAVIAGLETTSLTLSNILIQALFEGFGDDDSAS